MKKSYSELEIDSFRKYVISKENKQYIKAFYWYLKNKYYSNKAW